MLTAKQANALSKMMTKSSKLSNMLQRQVALAAAEGKSYTTAFKLSQDDITDLRKLGYEVAASPNVTVVSWGKPISQIESNVPKSAPARRKPLARVTINE